MKPVYQYNGVIDANTPGWTYVPLPVAEKTFNRFEGVYKSEGVRLESPRFDVSGHAFRFLKLSYECATPREGYSSVCCGLCFYGVQGETYPDIYVAIDPTDGRFVEGSRVFYGREHAVEAQVFFQIKPGVEVRNVAVTAVSVEEAAAWCDAVYAALPPLHDAPPRGRHALIPRTMEALRNGTPWRVVMLGDSIVNDTFNSNVQALIARRHPTSRLSFVCSVRGSTGCWYYHEPANFGPYVSDRAPDLLVVGGVSNTVGCTLDQAVDAVGDVIRMARERCGCEVLLLSGPLGGVWREFAGESAGRDAKEVYAPPLAFWRALEELARELRVAFLDAGSLWRAYLRAHRDRDPLWYHRDLVHGNRRGQQIAGRMLDAWFAAE